MAEETGATGATPEGAQTPEGATPTGQKPEGAKPEGDTGTLREPGKAALAAERDARREAERRASEAERQLQSLQDAGKSELERAISRLDRQSAELETERATRAQLEKRLAEGELLELKRSIAVEMGVPLEAAHRLAGEDTRALKADAQRYLDERKKAEGDLGLGRGGAASGRSGADMNARIREALGRG